MYVFSLFGTAEVGVIFGLWSIEKTTSPAHFHFQSGLQLGDITGVDVY